MEDQILNDAFKHSRDWLGQVYEQPGYMKALYTPLLNYPMDKQAGVRDRTRAPTIKVKIPRDEKTQQYRTEVFNVSRTQLYPNEEDISITEIIPKGSMVACNLYCAGIWVAGGKFGVIWNLSQAMVKPSESIKKGECYLPSVDEDGNPIEEQNKEESISDTPKDTVKNNHESDGEDESPVQPLQPAVEVVEEPPAVVEEPKKKIVKKGAK